MRCSIGMKTLVFVKEEFAAFAAFNDWQTGRFKGMAKIKLAAGKNEGFCQC